MAKTIWKYKLKPTTLADIPAAADILHVGAQGEDICLWALVDTEKQAETRTIQVFGTGQDIPVTQNLDYIGTVQMDDGLVSHVFENVGGPAFEKGDHFHATARLVGSRKKQS